ncbi:exosome complex component 10-like [Rhinoderma darwinii]|uniref:exosome complex component 10-like n=1 Tax=Rhinoderma darwinii TaxID=43563 RepID=UPI003F66E988
MARKEDESTGYVLPNHMLMKISEELPKEPQGIVACCNPVPPLVRQQINELCLLLRQAREMPLRKTETSSAKKKGPMPNPEKMENLLFGPHDLSKTPMGHLLLAGAAVEISTGSLFTDEDPAPPAPHSPVAVRAVATITFFSDPEDGGDEMNGLSLSQQKAQRILESFDNPFRMYLPSDIRGAHASQAAKLDPNTKMFEISNRWKLVSIAQQEREAKAKEEARKQRQADKDAREKKKMEFKLSAANLKSVREQLTQEEATVKRERAASESGTETPKAVKKRIKHSGEPTEPPLQTPFTPFDYSKSNFKVFAGSSNVKSQADFDPNKQTQGKKNPSGKKAHQAMGNKGMSFTAGKSDRGFRHSWPKR